VDFGLRISDFGFSIAIFSSTALPLCSFSCSSEPERSGTDTETGTGRSRNLHRQEDPFGDLFDRCALGLGLIGEYQTMAQHRRRQLLDILRSDV